MPKLPRRFVVAASTAAALALGVVLVIAAPTSADDLDLAPIQRVVGNDTDLNTPTGIVVAPDGTIYVAEDEYFEPTAQILVFAPGSTGDAAPERLISGPSTRLHWVGGLALDSSGDLYAADRSGYVVEFAPDANGNALPIRTIGGSTHSTLANSVGIAIDSTGSIYVTDESPAQIAVFASTASGDVAPIRTIGGASNSNTGLSDPTGIAVEPDGSIVESEYLSTSIRIFASRASGDVAPTQVISGLANTELSGDSYVALDHAGNIYASNNSTDSITEYPETSTGDVAPTHQIVGPATWLFGPGPISIDPEDRVYVANAQELMVFAANLDLTSVAAHSGSTSGRTRVTLHGYGFAAGDTVTFGGIAATDVAVVSSTELTAVTPAHAAGAVDVVVAQGATTSTLTDGFTFAVVLATTGVDPAPATGAGLLLLALGALLLGLRRRTRAARS